MALMNPAPTFEHDFLSHEGNLDPCPHYDRLRLLGPAVWLVYNQVWEPCQMNCTPAQQREIALGGNWRH